MSKDTGVEIIITRSKWDRKSSWAKLVQSIEIKSWSQATKGK